MAEPATTVREARVKDVPAILGMIEGLAAFERLSDHVDARESDLREHLFGERRYAEALVAERREASGGGPEGLVGYALYFHTYSTFLTKPGLFLEDLFVRAEHRRRGIGRALLARLAEIAVERGCGRLEWSVLDWNEKAIGFYRSTGAFSVDGWRMYRLEGDRLARLAGSGGE